MSPPLNIGIVQFPGSNTERETCLAVRRAGLHPLEILWNDPPQKLAACAGIIIIGGFSYEDRSRAGVIASLEPVMESIRERAQAGVPVLGICNGAQILVESGLIPGLPDHRPGLALTDNRRVSNGHVLGTGYYNAWTNLQLAVPPERCAFSRHLNLGDRIRIPLAHGQGRFVLEDSLLEELIANGQTVFRYCDEDGNIRPEFPVNPNGSRYNLAAVCNPAGNVMAIMPHPERSSAGDCLFTSLREFLQDTGPRTTYPALQYIPPDIQIDTYQPGPGGLELTVELIITDNEAASVQNALRRRGVEVKITRHTHWEITTRDGDLSGLKEQLAGSGELFNSNKEFPTTLTPDPGTIRLLVRSRDDVVGQQKLETLTKRFGLDHLTSVRRGILWSLTAPGEPGRVLKQVLDQHILFNCFAHRCYTYGGKNV